MPKGPLRRLFWCVADQFDYLLTLARLRVLDPLVRRADIFGARPLGKVERRHFRSKETFTCWGRLVLDRSLSTRALGPHHLAAYYTAPRGAKHARSPTA
jgi:hypothetical protein